MGFGFNLFFMLILIPASIILLLALAISRKKIFWRIFYILWLSVIGLVIFSVVVRWIMPSNKLKKDDIYGEYVVDRSKYPGAQSDWQYQHFRFSINNNDEIEFHITKKNKIIKTYREKISFLEQYDSPRLVIGEQKKHHVISQNPTLYRQKNNFYYVFYSPKFGKMFFRKGKWKAIEKDPLIL